MKLSLLKERVLSHVSSHQLSEYCTNHAVLCCGTIVTICMFRFVSPHCRCAGSGGLHVGRGSVSAVFIQFPRGVSPLEQGHSAPITCMSIRLRNCCPQSYTCLGVVICLMLLMQVTRISKVPHQEPAPVAGACDHCPSLSNSFWQRGGSVAQRDQPWCRSWHCFGD